jgi:hypothetical protein
MDANLKISFTVMYLNKSIGTSHCYQSWAPALFSLFHACQREAKKAQEREDKQKRQARKKKSVFALFLVFALRHTESPVPGPEIARFGGWGQGSQVFMDVCM